MAVETTALTRPASSLRVDRPDPSSAPETFSLSWSWSWNWPRRFLALAVLATGFVLIGGGSLDPGPIESRLGMACFESIGPYGQVYAGWDPSVWVGQLAPALIWTWGEGGTPTSASLRWPAAIAGVAIGLILARRASNTLGGRAGVLIGLAWYGNIALMDRSSGAGIDLITALGTIAALDRVLGRGSDLLAGAWVALAFLAGGWPPVAIVLLATIILGRPGATISWRLLLPPALAASAWSIWALKVAPAEVWAAALTLPLTERPAWLLIPSVLALALPWTPLAALVASRSVRGGWSEPGQKLVMGWLQIAGACLLAGTLVPGLATAARMPALAAIAVAAGAVCERALAGRSSDPLANGARNWFLGWPILLTFVWAALIISAGGYLAAAVPYYRSVSVLLIILTAPACAVAVRGVTRRDPLRAFLAVAMVAIFIKLAHFGYYVPEWNYRLSQGPWGRAVGQWVPPRSPIYTLHTWNTDLAFATKHAVYQLPSPQHLAYQPGQARYILLLDSEYVNWPATAPVLLKVSEFQDEFGGTRVLARTPGPLPWNLPASNQ